uniref:Hemolysin activation/secretion protein n=1 Tax=Candidatus Kentrum sp. DK TaxID=2126562 RepID=A0A450SDY7_9GAMM|nr:MAG: Hemolysin activation/secretion protein [Candidatus Kentron sp. DK]
MTAYKHAIPLSVLTLAITHALSGAVLAAPPDAGQVIQEMEQPRMQPAPASDLEFDIQTPKSTDIPPGGPQVTINTIRFSGNTVFTEQQLLIALGDVVGNRYDLAGLRALTDRITAYYRENDYPFARAWLPAQTMTGGELRIEIVEGNYGAAKAIGDDEEIIAGAQRFLDNLEPGAVIEGKVLERATLILNDQPGIRAVPIIRPGRMAGTGDLNVHVKRESLFGGQVSVDNHGNRYTGRERAKVSLYANSPFLFGDQLTLSGLYSQEDMWFGGLGYNLPLGTDGLRANVGYSHTYYELGEEYASLQSHGTARVTSVGLSYPVIRSRQLNVRLSGTYQHKKLRDEVDSVTTREDTSSDTLPISVGFDLRDSLYGGGITYGSLGWTPGDLDLDSGLLATDSTTAKTDGGFDKFNFDVARLQALPRKFTFFGRVSAQWTDDNLNSSEGFGIGGATGVRAYPSGEGYGDKGILGQAELRYALAPAFAPYVFYDSGRVTTNAQPWDNSVNHRSLSGAGAGMRINQDNWDFDAGVAWSLHGGAPESDTEDENPKLWVQGKYRF